ncbi:MAG: thioredoxin [Deltaproteobacteria bacterium]|nr:MAG: thioredoxin [Deltaproteobacteria bacterium]
MVITCPSCQAKNAVEAGKLDKEPVCGKCQAKLPMPDAPVELGDSDFDKIVKESKLPVLVDFWAPWCGPCRMMSPILENMAKKYAGKLLVAKLNTDDNPQTPASFGIRGIPTMILFRGGQEASRQVGAVPEAMLEKMVGVA